MTARTERSELLGDPRLTAEEIRDYEFGRKLGLGGFDPEDVRDFQRRVADEVEQLAEEGQRAREFPVAEAAAREATHILVSARRTGEEFVRTAQGRAQEVSAEAQGRREQIIADAVGRRQDIITRAKDQADAIVREAADRFPADAQAQVAYLDSFREMLVGYLTHSAEILHRRLPVQ